MAIIYLKQVTFKQPKKKLKCDALEDKIREYIFIVFLSCFSCSLIHKYGTIGPTTLFNGQ